MSWKKYFKPVNSVLPAVQRSVDSSHSFAAVSKYSNWLPEVYSGPPDRLQRYSVYENMGYDHEISAALDTIADFGTAPDEITKLPLVIEYNDEPTPTEIQILDKSLNQWTRLNKFSKRIWGMFRKTLAYGDQFFIRDPETFELYWIDPAKVEKVIVNESDGKKIESYFIKDIDLNMKNLVATNQLNKLSSQAFGTNSIVFSPPMAGNMNYVSGGFGSAGSANYKEGGATAVDAEHIVQLTLTDGMNAAWPFGLSILEQIYKVYKQKELLEDAILIYRIQRAPERRVFFIDVGTMPPNKASQYLERIKYEVQQKRIPSRSGNGAANLTDSVTNPMSILDDFYFSVSCVTLDTKVPLLDGRTLELSEIIAEFNAGKENYAYSVNQATHEMIPGKIVWGGVTRKNAELVEVLLDNGEKLRLTPDHRFIMRDGSEVEAQNLKPGDSLMPLYLHSAKTSPKQKSKAYLRYIDNATGKMKWVHTAICPKVGSGKESHIHHVDFNSANNNPTNLVEMSADAHYKLHKDIGTYAMQTAWTDPEKREKLLTGIRSAYKDMSPEFKQMLSERNRKNSTSGHASRSVERKAELAVKYSKGQKARDLKLVYSDVLVNYILAYAKVNVNEITSISDLSNMLGNDKIFLDIWQNDNCFRMNKAEHIDRSLSKFTIQRLREIFALTPYGTWDNYSKFIGVKFVRHDFRPGNQKIYDDNVAKYNEHPKTCLHCNTKIEYDRRMFKFCNNSCATSYNNLLGNTGCKIARENKKARDQYYNHKVISVTFLSEREDTGDITIETATGHHNFATAAGVYIHNSEGRGSRVEVLPGGDNLGCFSLDTKVKLIDGRDLSIIEIRDEMEQGKVLFTYSCHPTTGEIAPGLISGAGVTQKDASVINLYLSNGEKITCTPEHKFPIVVKGFIEAKDLDIGMQLNTRFGEPIFLEKIEDLNEKIDVGTLTIDCHETYHNWHTYLLSAGVFVKNSIDDLRYFNNKMLRALGVPSSYLPTGPEDGTAAVSDGRVGTAFIQEFRFSKVVTRYQQQIVEPLDNEFKLFLKHRGITIDNSLFQLKFTAAQSFSEYRQLELDAARINSMTALTDIPYISKRFVLKTYLGWSQEQMNENERMWREERSRMSKSFEPDSAVSSNNPTTGLSDIGITSSSIDDMAPESNENAPGEEGADIGATDQEVDNFGQQ